MSIHRLIDANLNRAREALRVMEDVARFTLGDRALSEELKSTRHRLGAGAGGPAADPLLLAHHRDTPGDVGRDVTTAAEGRRDGVRGVAVAAGKRAGEALRSLEEAFKAVPGGAPEAAGMKGLRYRVYTLEARLIAALGAGGGTQWPVCVLLTESLCVHHPWERVAEMAVEGGAACLQLREKSLDGADLLGRAAWLVGMARRRGVAVIVNDRPDVALLAGADGVHVGQTDLPVGAVRKLAGARLLVGVSTATMDQALAAAEAGADYCGVGPMFATGTKHKPVLSGPGYLRAYLADARTARVPHLAIAGITAENAAGLRAAGCRGIAVSSAVCSAPDPLAATRALVEAMGPAA